MIALLDLNLPRLTPSSNIARMPCTMYMPVPGHSASIDGLTWLPGLCRPAPAARRLHHRLHHGRNLQLLLHAPATQSPFCFQVSLTPNSCYPSLHDDLCCVHYTFSLV